MGDVQLDLEITSSLGGDGLSADAARGHAKSDMPPVRQLRMVGQLDLAHDVGDDMQGSLRILSVLVGKLRQGSVWRCSLDVGVENSS